MHGGICHALGIPFKLEEIFVYETNNNNWPINPLTHWELQRDPDCYFTSKSI